MIKVLMISRIVHFTVALIGIVIALMTQVPFLRLLALHGQDLGQHLDH